jgi:hypothetical protein
VHYKNLKREINRISKINDLTKCKKEIVKLNEKLNEKKVKITKSGNYYYCYLSINYYDKEKCRSVETIIPNSRFGRIPAYIYENNKDIIKKLNYKELIKLLEEI